MLQELVRPYIIDADTIGAKLNSRFSKRMDTWYPFEEYDIGEMYIEFTRVSINIVIVSDISDNMMEFLLDVFPPYSYVLNCSLSCKNMLVDRGFYPIAFDDTDRGNRRFYVWESDLLHKGITSVYTCVRLLFTMEGLRVKLYREISNVIPEIADMFEGETLVFEIREIPFSALTTLLAMRMGLLCSPAKIKSARSV
jgi:hypothetical protein